MHSTPTQRAVRLIILSIGFALFIIIAIRSGGQASNPQLVKDKPLLAGISRVVGVLPQAARAEADIEQLSPGGAAEAQAVSHATDAAAYEERAVVPATHPHAELSNSVSKAKKTATDAVPTAGRGEQL